MSNLSEAEARQLERQSKALESIAKTLKAILQQMIQANMRQGSKG